MPLTLVRRAGEDTLGKLESAAPERFREAEKLRAGYERLGAIYLYGYSVEICLKAAYYRTIGLVPKSPIDYTLHRKPAEAAIKDLPLLPRHGGMRGPGWGHHIVGWALLLEQKRIETGRPMDDIFASEMHRQAGAVFHHWTEILRYRANKPYNTELEAVRTAADWFHANARRLWR